MNAASRTASDEGTFSQIAVLTEKHRSMLEELRFRHRLNFSETIRLGIELVADQFAPKAGNPGDSIEA